MSTASLTLPPGWAEASVPEIAEILDSRRVPLNSTERASRKGPYAYYGANGALDTIDDYIFKGPHVLLAEDGGYFDAPERGVAYQVDGKFWVNNHAHILSPFSGIEVGFLRQVLNALDWMPFVSGTTRLKLTQEGLNRAKIPVPPSAEQRRIVATIDALTARSKRARAELVLVRRFASDARRAVLAGAFDLDAPARPLRELLSEGLIGLVRSKAEQSDTGTPYIRMQHFDLGGEWSFHDLTCVKATRPEVARYGLRAEDLLFNTRNSVELVGKVAIWPHGRPEHVYNNNLLRLRFKADVIPAFAFHQMRAPAFRAHLETLKSATTSVAAIYQGALMEALMSLPPLPEQRAIVARIEAAFARIDAVAAEAERAAALLDRLDQAVLAKAFRGELVPRDPADQPASALLARLAASRETAPKRRARKAAA